MVNSVELMQLCRLCLVKDEVNIPIFDNETDVQQIFLKISTCLPVKVTQDDNLPKKICNDCSYKLDLCYQFWNTSANSEKQLVTWLNEVGLSQETLNEAKLQKTESNSTPGLVLKQETIEPESESSHEVVNNVSTESQEYILQQQQLPYQTPAFPFTDDNFVSGESANAGASKTHTNNKRESTLKRKRQAVATVTQPDSDDDVDEDIDDPTETKVAKTEETSDDDRDDDGLNDEESTEFAGVPSTSTDNEQPGPSGIGKNVVDAPCRRKSSPRNNRSSHQKGVIETADSSLFIYIKKESDDSSNGNGIDYNSTQSDVDTKAELLHCFNCEATFNSKLSYAMHSISHSEDGKYSCPICEFTTTYKDKIKLHKHTRDNKKDYACKICRQTFLYSRDAEEHENIHLGRKPFICEVCGKEYALSKHLASHRRHQHWEILKIAPSNKFDCTTCQKHYTTASGLWRHRLRYHNVQQREQFLCDECGKALTSKEGLKFHRRTHSGYKPFHCSACPKKFVKKQLLKEHERTHSGERPFICKYCNRAFTQRTPLKIHERSHTGERPYQCRFCDGKYVSKSVADTHMRNCKGKG
ncbi:zinc finger protein 287 isoform X22 [Agrilus planipennis]|uniref:Zinc finger protein 287 isoform X21 n=2 Tax=Agrilus planipennis TaxID=224129 RepID=A0A7F5R9B3_AGRPL|nr:zinc finger protein 287 isoform X21 [Agrilus planipennis]XP_025832554.1 zinc finger protein 287 isoform X22 [Agrilus planipennis]